MGKKNDFYQGIYRDPKTNKLVVKVFSFGDIAGVGNTNALYISAVMEKITREFGIILSMTLIEDPYYCMEVDDPVVAYINIEEIIKLTANGDELDMSCFDTVVEEFAYNDEYQEFIYNRLLNMEYGDKDMIMKVYNYIADKAIGEIQYHLEMVTENWKKWKDNPANKQNQ